MATKSDMERVGLFKELGYHTIGDPYVSGATTEFNKASHKGKQFVLDGEKSRAALKDAYFSEFSRVFAGESYTDVPKMRRQARIASNNKKIGKEWVPSSGVKDPSGLGSHFGTFSGPISHFEAISKAPKSTGIKGKNLYTNPGKQGTGYGYLGITLGKYPEYKADTYDASRKEAKRDADAHRTQLKGRSVFRLGMHGGAAFQANPYDGAHEKYRSRSAGPRPKVDERKIFRPSHPAKLDGGMKAGCFSVFPTYSSSPYGSKAHGSKTDKKFLPSAGPKSKPTTSVLNQNVTRSINSLNYRNVLSVMSY